VRFAFLIDGSKRARDLMAEYVLGNKLLTLPAAVEIAGVGNARRLI
jgi:hypothetical protein